MAMRVWLMKRNCSFSPKQVGYFYASIVAFSLMVAGYFWLFGVWMILIFTCIEITALTIALYIYSRHALDYEKITIDGKRLQIEKSWGGKVDTLEFNTAWARIDRTEKHLYRLLLKHADIEMPIGIFVNQDDLPRFEKELKAYLG
ncbi:MAG: DUF2244 domain-containing protein [Polynucleobacter sp.]|jgi:uncharacterized membrane protein|nr:DUF2244 domain-containing protein [Polynucleobacter sp.]MDZ4056638.1 DUF2244 domain-containing protein [Polynucleobacter sp.]